jgi:hypothetical protein
MAPVKRPKLTLLANDGSKYVRDIPFLLMMLRPLKKASKLMEGKYGCLPVLIVTQDALEASLSVRRS